MISLGLINYYKILETGYELVIKAVFKVKYTRKGISGCLHHLFKVIIRKYHSIGLKSIFKNYLKVKKFIKSLSA